MQAIWNVILEKWPYSDRALFTAVAWTAEVVTYWTLNGLLYFIYKRGYLQKYKILPDKWPSYELVKECVRDTLINHLLLRPLFAYYVLYPAFHWRGSVPARTPLPSFGAIILQIAFCFLVTDFTFYWFHRALHLPMFYKRIHKQHHKFATTVGVASEYSHPLEDVTNSISTLAGTFILGEHMHMAVFWLYLTIRLSETIDAHSGYNFPFSPWRFIPLLHGGSDRHDFHHSHNIGNYGMFSYLDRMFGTDKAYVEFKKKQQEQKQK